MRLLKAAVTLAAFFVLLYMAAFVGGM